MFPDLPNIYFDTLGGFMTFAVALYVVLPCLIMYGIYWFISEIHAAWLIPVIALTTLALTLLLTGCADNSTKGQDYRLKDCTVVTRGQEFVTYRCEDGVVCYLFPNKIDCWRAE
jgi:hypothetical protein